MYSDFDYYKTVKLAIMDSSTFFNAVDNSCIKLSTQKCSTSNPIVGLPKMINKQTSNYVLDNWCEYTAPDHLVRLGF